VSGQPWEPEFIYMRSFWVGRLTTLHDPGWSEPVTVRIVDAERDNTGRTWWWVKYGTQIQ
jgi:hypothetical protein